MKNPSLQSVLGLPLSAWVRVVSGTGLIEHHLDGKWAATGSRINPATGELEQWDDGAYEATGWLYDENAECLRQAGLTAQQPTETTRRANVGSAEKKSAITNGPEAMVQGTGTREPVAKRIELPSNPPKKDLWKRKGPKPWSNFSEWSAVPHHRFLLAGWFMLAGALIGYFLTEPGSFWHKAAFWMCLTLVFPVVLALRNRSGLHAALLVFATFTVCRLFAWQQVWSSPKTTQQRAAVDIVTKVAEPPLPEQTIKSPSKGIVLIESSQGSYSVMFDKTPESNVLWVVDQHGREMKLGEYSYRPSVQVSNNGRFIVVHAKLHNRGRGVMVYSREGPDSLSFKALDLDIPDSGWGGWLVQQIGLPPDAGFEETYLDPKDWVGDSKLPVTVYAKSMGVGSYGLSDFLMIWELPSGYGVGEIKVTPSSGRKTHTLVRFTEHKDEPIPLDANGRVLNPENALARSGTRPPTHVMPLPDALKKGNEAMESRRNVLTEHHRNAGISLEAFMAGFADEVVVPGATKAVRKTKDQLREEEAKDRTQYASIEETIVKGATMEKLDQGDKPFVEYDLQINNTLNDHTRTPYRGVARIEVQLTPLGDSWRIMARRTKRIRLEREGEPAAEIGRLQPMDDDSEPTSKSSAEESADSQVLTMQRFLHEHHLKSSGNLDLYIADYAREVLDVSPNKKVTKSRAQLTEEERKDHLRFVSVSEKIVSDIKILEQAERTMKVEYILRFDNVKADAARTRYQADVRIVSRIQFTADGPKINARYTTGGQPKLTEGRQQTSTPKPRVPPTPTGSRPASPGRSGDWRDAAEAFERR